MAATGLRTVHAEDEDRNTLRELNEILENTGLAVLMTDDHPIELPDPLFEILRQAIDVLLEGGSVSIVPHTKLLTTQEAADYLGVSRPYLISILDSEGIGYQYAGSHRRIPLNEIDRYRRRRDAERRAVLNEMTREAYELGLYDVPRGRRGHGTRSG